MLIGGLQKCSLIDYPGKISAIIFTLGCNFRCSYCHNPELVYPELFIKPIPEEEVLSFLAKRVCKLDAVTVTGGEPTLQTDLLDYILKIKKLGFLVKLDSNASNPEMLEEVISSKAVDYVAMDVKAPLEKYREVTNSAIDSGKIKNSIQLIMSSNTAYEFRITITKSELDKADILRIGKLIEGAELCVLQKYVAAGKDVPELKTYSDCEFGKFQNIMNGFVKKCIIR